MIFALIEAALRALTVAVGVGVGLRLFRVKNVAAQKAAWGMTLAAALAIPAAMHWQILPPSVGLKVPAPKWSNARIPLAYQASTASSSRASLVFAQPQSAPSPASREEAGGRFPAPAISQSEFDAAVKDSTPQAILETNPATASLFRELSARAEQAARWKPAQMAGGLYLIVLGGLLLRLIFGLGLALRMWLVARPLSGVDAEWLQGLPVRASSAIYSPVTIGSGVVLPADYRNWDAEKLRIVLAHESSHVRQGDFYVQIAAGVHAAVFWFSPLGWWLKRKLSDLSEAISDRAALEAAASRASYAQILLEFAALPRPTALGVAMANHRNLSHRIERLLNESSFRQAFAGSRRRVLLAMAMVPLALFAGTSLIRVEAAQEVQAPPAPAAVQAPASPAVPSPAPAPAAPAAAPDVSDPVSVQAPDAAHVPPPAGIPEVAPVAPVPPVAAAVPPVEAVPPPPAGEGDTRYGEIHDAADDRTMTISNSQDDATIVANSMRGSGTSTSRGKGYSYSYSSDGDTWALITDPSDKVTFSGDWHDSTRESIDKVRKLTSGKFLWFSHEGKDYFIDDASVVDGIQSLYKPMDELGRKQEELGKQQEALGRQQEELGRKQEQASIPTPDISKELAKLNEAVARLEAKKTGTMSQEEVADLEAKVGEIQGRLGALQGEIGANQGELGEAQGRLGAEQGRLGSEQGRLGAEQGRIAQEAEGKVRSIIAESLRNGKAKPVQ